MFFSQNIIFLIQTYYMDYIAIGFLYLKKKLKNFTYSLILFMILSNEFIVDQVSGLWQMPVIKINQQKKMIMGLF